jgi:hypothetical protein
MHKKIHIPFEPSPLSQAVLFHAKTLAVVKDAGAFLPIVTTLDPKPVSDRFNTLKTEPPTCLQSNRAKLKRVGMRAAA